MAWMRENAIALNQAKNKPQERKPQTSLRQASKHQFRGDECVAHYLHAPDEPRADNAPFGAAPGSQGCHST